LQASQELTDARSRAKGYAGRRSVLDERTGSIEHTRDLYRQQYLDLGTRSLLDLLNAEQEFHGARVESVNNMLDLQRMQVDCLAAAGGLRRAFRLDGHTLAGVELTP
jgi:adhesin transport system outer membrane protein